MAEGTGEILAPFNRCLKSGQIFPLKIIKGQSIKIFFFQHFFQIGLLIEQFYFRLAEAVAFFMPLTYPVSWQSGAVENTGSR